MPTPDDLLAFGGCYAYAAHRAERRLSAAYDEALAPFGLTIRQFAILGEVAYAPGLPLARLARRLTVDPTTLTRAIKPLVQRNLIILAVDRSDGRRKLVTLTPEGIGALDAATPAWYAAQRKVAESLGPDLTQALMQSLNDTVRRLKSATNAS